MAAVQRLVSSAPLATRRRFASWVSLPTVQHALIHSSERLRLAAFGTIEAAVLVHYPDKSPSERLEAEASMWRDSLPFALKSVGQEYLLELMRMLSSFLQRLLKDGATTSTSETKAKDTEKLGLSTTHPNPVPLCVSFVCDFLIDDILIGRSAYPGTVEENEAFAFPILRCALAFAVRDLTVSVDNKRLLNAEPVSNRQLIKTEETILRKILQKLVSSEVFAALTTTLMSMWDNSRLNAYAHLIALVRVAQAKQLPLPTMFASESTLGALKLRSIYLASSPRQRESDSGARLLAFAYSMCRDEGLVQEIVHVANDRVESMKSSLAMLLSATGNATVQEGLDLPLAHGLVQSLRHIVDSFESDTRSTNNTAGTEEPVSKEQASIRVIMESIADLCYRSIQLSLSVVADVKDGEVFEGMDVATSASGSDTATGSPSSLEKGAVPLNVNTGAIGANGTFSSVHAATEREEMMRRATQRVVVSLLLVVVLLLLLMYDAGSGLTRFSASLLYFISHP